MQVFLLTALFGILIHAIILIRMVETREPESRSLAVWVIFFSGMWFIGPFTYFGFRRSKPLLARACLQQMAIVTLVWALFVAFDVSPAS